QGNRPPGDRIEKGTCEPHRDTEEGEERNRRHAQIESQRQQLAIPCGQGLQKNRRGIRDQHAEVSVLPTRPLALEAIPGSGEVTRHPRLGTEEWRRSRTRKL